MNQIICELRKSWKSKHLIILLLAFLCFFAFVYNSCLSSAKTEYRNLLINQRIDNAVIGSRYSQLKYEVEYTPVNERRENLLEEYYAWKDICENYYDFIIERFDPMFFEDNESVTHAYQFYHALYECMENGIYQGELDHLEGYTKKEVKTNMHFYKYLLDKDIDPYIHTTDPNLANFIMQLFDRDHLFLLIVLASAFLIYQLTHDIENGTYKYIYTIPKQRWKVLFQKIVSNYIIVGVAFILSLGLFSIIPITQYGIGSFNYPYFITTTNLAYYMPLFMKSLIIFLLMLFLFMLLGTLMSFIAKLFSKALSFTGAIFVCVYFALRLFGNHIVFAWLPFFYLNVKDIAGNHYVIPYWSCLVMLIVAILLLAFISYRYIEKMDMEGSDE